MEFGTSLNAIDRQTLGSIREGLKNEWWGTLVKDRTSGNMRLS